MNIQFTPNLHRRKGTEVINAHSLTFNGGGGAGGTYTPFRDELHVEAVVVLVL